MGPVQRDDEDAGVLGVHLRNEAVFLHELFDGGLQFSDAASGVQAFA